MFIVTTTQKPIERVRDAHPDAKEGKNGWWYARCRGHNDKHASLSIREKENGGVILKCHAGCTQEQILTGAGLQTHDLYPQGNYRPKRQVRPKLELIDLAHDKLLPWQFLFNEGVNDGYTYHGQSVVTIPYYTIDGQEYSKVRVRLGLSGKDSKWDENTPGEIMPYGLSKLDMAHRAGYLLIGEGESDAWTCWFHGIPYLGVPGATNEKCLKGADLQDIPCIYIIQEPDRAGKQFYGRVHAQLRKTGNTGKIYALPFKRITGCKDPNELHKHLLKEKDTSFAEAITCALQQAIPDNATTDKQLLGSGRAAIDAAIRSKDKETLYHLASDVMRLSPLDRQRMRLDIRSIWGKDFPMREFDDLLNTERQKLESEQRRKPLIKSGRELMQLTFAPVDWIADKLYPPGLIAVAGKQKIGKSWLMLSSALAVASGGLLFDKIPVKRGNVLYIALEDNEQRMQERLHILLPSSDAMPAEFEYVEKWPRMDADGLFALEDWIRSRPNPRLIIIDPWVKVKPRLRARAGETGYDMDYEALEGVKQLADTYKVCILILFHLRKAEAEDPFDELNATTGVTACADGFLRLKRSRGETNASLWGTGRDYREDVDLALSFEKGKWSVIGKGSEYALTQASKEVIDVLNQSQKPMYPKEIAATLGISEGTIRKRLFDMRNRNEVIDTEQGYIANRGNAGNGGNTCNGGNEGNAHPLNEHDERVSSLPQALPPLPLQKLGVTHLDPPVETTRSTCVTSVTSIENKNSHDDISEVVEWIL